MKISQFPIVTTVQNEDLLLIEQLGAFRSVTKANFLAGLSSGSNNNISWNQKNSNFSITNSIKTIVDSSSANINIAFPTNPTAGIEIELKRISNFHKVLLNVINKINGVTIQSGFETQLLFSNYSTKLIYLDSTSGWYSIPQADIRIRQPLSLPISGLAQKFYALDITGLSNNASIPQWNDTAGNNRLSTQSSTSLRPISKTGIFDNGLLPSVYFSGANYFTTNLNYLSNTKYTIAVVEARSSDSSGNYLFGQENADTNQALHVGYRSNTSFTLAQFSNDLDVSTSDYTIFTPTIWIVSNNSRGKEIYRKKIKLASNLDTNNLTIGTNGRLGRALTNNFNGHIGLLAVWIGEKSVSEIEAIFTNINSTFGVY